MTKKSLQSRISLGWVKLCTSKGRQFAVMWDGVTGHTPNPVPLDHMNGQDVSRILTNVPEDSASEVERWARSFLPANV